MEPFFLAIFRWIHFLAGITWIGLLYYFNFVQVPAMAQAGADKEGPGPAAISKYVAPRALLWFRWSALATWLAGVIYLLINGQFGSAVILGIGESNAYATNIGIGGWLGTIMLLNVWVLIWPNQKKVLGIVQASDDEKAKARRVAALASRTNTLLSIPMLLFMGAASHWLPY
ncbi:MAG: hypothetical protein GWN84_08160 [Gammaproteobacteria bacterium]|nr:hypothetical protein [Gammaproteobacteria bacterium]NIR82856.1 hypothetical protein [Gammaproteobacteria bacterium]NIR89965.1 hypothetical protein [Gammaproteobacteria bacterium]NIU04014.1 hypothetical protein [Gammaproteobacteria bacterium]NIV51334.1 hypothetical protein [Gammaproteobacteria bacterium]